VRFAVESWAPEYGSAMEGAAEEVDPTANVEPGIEVAETDWAPCNPLAEPAACIAFVDGVRRVDAQVWITEESGETRPGLCATYAAGVLRCDGRAELGDLRVSRGLFTPYGRAQPIVTRNGTWEVRPSAGGIAELDGAVGERMRALEVDVSRTVTGADLIVLDGLLWGRTGIPDAIGYVKTHHTTYLRPDLNQLVARLEPGQRTPLFLVKTAWTRLSWYMRLPGGSGHPWAGIVRCEADPDIGVAAAAALADRAAVTLPRYASATHKDARAPQNLYPIGGLERELRHRLGDAMVLYRALLRAARIA